MSLRPASLPNARPAAHRPPHVIRADDLTGRPESRALWRPGGRGEATPTPPAAGRPSPMGYWLTEAAGDEPAAPGCRLQLLSPAEGEGAGPPPAAERPGGFGRPARTVKLKAPEGGSGDLVLTVTAHEARVVASPATWEVLAEPVLLAVCQYWRFAAVDTALDGLTERAKADLGHATMTGPSTVWQHGTLVERTVAVRALLLDLAHFAGPLTDPYPYLPDDRAVQAYEALADRLRLEPWAESLDDRFEMVEDTYVCATEKLFEYKNFAWEAFLEVVIILLLVAEVVLQFQSTFGE